MALSTPRRCRRSRSCVGPSWWFRCPSRHAVVAGSLGAAGFIGAIESQVGLRWLCCFAGRAAPLGAAEQVALWTPRRYRLSRLGAGLAVPVPAETFRGGRCAERGWFYSPDRVVREVGAAGPAFSLAGQHLRRGGHGRLHGYGGPTEVQGPAPVGGVGGGGACHELPWRSSPLCAAGSIPAIESSQRWPCPVAGKAVPSARRSGRCCGHRCPSGEQGPGAGGSGAHPGWPWCPVRRVWMAPLLVRGSAVTAGWRRWEGPANVGSRRGVHSGVMPGVSTLEWRRRYGAPGSGFVEVLGGCSCRHCCLGSRNGPGALVRLVGDGTCSGAVARVARGGAVGGGEAVGDVSGRWPGAELLGGVVGLGLVGGGDSVAWD